MHLPRKAVDLEVINSHATCFTGAFIDKDAPFFHDLHWGDRIKLGILPQRYP